MTIQLFYLFKCDEVIIGGDYNLVLDVENDKKGGLAKRLNLDPIDRFHCHATKK